MKFFNDSKSSGGGGGGDGGTPEQDSAKYGARRIRNRID